MPHSYLDLHLSALEIIGLFGFGAYVLAYALLTLSVVTDKGIPYFALNLVAAILVLVGLNHSFNLAAALIQIFWILISTVGIVLRLGQHLPGKGDRPKTSV